MFLQTKGNCCLNHIVSCPVKNDKEFPIFDYEESIYNAIEENQNIWIKPEVLALLHFQLIDG